MRIFFSVGEPSGDQHAAHLIEALQRRSPGVECVGFGGPLMEQAGCRLEFTLTNLAVMGFLRVLPLLRQFWGLYRNARRIFRENPPDAVVLVDFPGFNWWIARAAKAQGIPVYYFCPPQLWAWGAWRIKKVRKFIDHVLCCLPFEAEWYRGQGVAAECVGHPFFDEVRERKLDAGFLAAHQPARGESQRTVAVLPGSRNHEVHHNWPLQLEIMTRLQRRFGNLRFLVACYKESQRQYCAEQLAAWKTELPVELCVGKTSEIIELGDVCVLVSGSVSLEVLARTTPAVVIYHCTRLFSWFAQAVITCKYMTLPNLVVDRILMPEFPTVGNPEQKLAALIRVLSRWLEDPAERHRHRAELREVYERIGQPGATERVAEILLRHHAAASAIRRAA